MTPRAWRAFQWIAITAVLVFVGLRVQEQWAELSVFPFPDSLNWPFLGASAACVATSYAVLIWTWQRTVLAWGERLAFGAAARIWFVSNLGRYIPGKVWQIGAMGVMAQQEGVSPVAAVGSSLVISLINVLTGIAVAVVCGAGDLGAPRWAYVGIGISTALVVGAPWLLPVLAKAATTILRRPIELPRLPLSAIWIAAAGCTVAWLLYGIAFCFLHAAVLGEPTGDVLRSTAAFTGSYIAGFLFLLAPGGIGVREDVLYRLMGQLGLATGGAAWIVVFASRVWLTLIEVTPGLLLLLLHRGRSKPLTTQT
ncbi:MAG: hypothetical protein P3A28_04610 [Gemmatimonadota bacterium]|nr:hypothetical protein [Gemmatimonadota bacterium]